VTRRPAQVPPRSSRAADHHHTTVPRLDQPPGALVELHVVLLAEPKEVGRDLPPSETEGPDVGVVEEAAVLAALHHAAVPEVPEDGPLGEGGDGPAAGKSHHVLDGQSLSLKGCLCLVLCCE